jgi:hypothetical protein
MRQSIQPLTITRIPAIDLQLRFVKTTSGSSSKPPPIRSFTLRFGWRSALKILFGGLKFTLIVGGDRDIVEDVLELDGNYLGLHDSSRRINAWKGN